jgi:hypothetical protein
VKVGCAGPKGQGQKTDAICAPEARIASRSQASGGPRRPGGRAGPWEADRMEGGVMRLAKQAWGRAETLGDHTQRTE